MMNNSSPSAYHPIQADTQNTHNAAQLILVVGVKLSINYASHKSFMYVHATRFAHSVPCYIPGSQWRDKMYIFYFLE